LHNKETPINNIKVKYIIIGGISIFAVLFIPDYLAISIQYSGIGEIYLFTLTEVGKSRWYAYYYIVYIGTLYILVLGSLTVLNVLILRALNRIKIINGRQKNVYSITRMIIFTNTYFILVRVLHIISLAIFQIEKTKGILYTPQTNLLRQFAYFILIASYGFNIYVYAYFDKSVRKKIKEHFKLDKKF